MTVGEFKKMLEDANATPNPISDTARLTIRYRGGMAGSRFPTYRLARTSSFRFGMKALEDLVVLWLPCPIGRTAHRTVRPAPSDTVCHRPFCPSGQRSSPSPTSYFTTVGTLDQRTTSTRVRQAAAKRRMCSARSNAREGKWATTHGPSCPPMSTPGMVKIRKLRTVPSTEPPVWMKPSRWPSDAVRVVKRRTKTPVATETMLGT